MRTTLALAFTMTLAGISIQAERLANGLEFRTPDGWTTKANQEAAVLLPPDMVMEPGGQDPSELYLVATLPGIQSLQDPQLVSTLRRQYLAANAQVHAVGTPEAVRAGGGTGYLYRFDGISEGVALRIQMYVVGLQGGGVAAVIAMARPALLARREATLSLVAASLSRQAGPADQGSNSVLASQWDQRLRGRKLYQFSGYSSSYGSGGMNSQKTLLLGANGTYQFHRSGSVSVYVNGASGGSVSQSGAQGSWRIHEQGGRVLLELVPSNGNPETIALTLDGSKTLLNGQRWLVGD